MAKCLVIQTGKLMNQSGFSAVFLKYKIRGLHCTACNLNIHGDFLGYKLSINFLIYNNSNKSDNITVMVYHS